MPEEKEPNIIVREIRGEKKVGFRGIEYIDKPESEMRELVEKRGDAIIEFYETEEEYNSPDKQWQFGRIVNEYARDQGSDIKQLLKYSTLDIAQSYDLKLFQNFYNCFPEGGYNSDYPWALYREMFVSKRIEDSKKVYERLETGLEEDVVPRTYEYRAYLRCDGYELDDILEALHELGSRQTSGLTGEKAAEGVRRIRIMAGLDPEIATVEKVENIIDERGLTEDD
jgi:hypothetical protein